MTKRRMCGMLAALTACFLLAAGLAQAGTTLTFLSPNAPNVYPAVEALTKAYSAKNPGVVFDIEQRPGGGEGDNIIKTRLATDEMADLFVYNSGSLMRALRPEMTLADLSGLGAMKLIYDDFKKVVSVDGKVYGIPFGTAMVGGVFYNKKIYEKLGLSVPKSWADFMANCQKIKDSGIAAPVIQSYRHTWTSQLFVLADFYNVQAAVPNFAEEYTANKAKYASTPAAMKGFERLKAVHDAGFLNKDFGAATYNDGLMMLALGEGAHYPMLSQALAAIKQDFPDELNDIGFFAQPGDDAAKNGVTVWMPNSIYISEKSKNKEEAKKFLEFVASPEGMEVYFTANSAQGPTLIEGAELPANTPPAVYDMLPYFEEGRTALALEFLSPVKGPSLEQITVEVGSGMRDPASAAAIYDEDVRKQARQLKLPGW